MINKKEITAFAKNILRTQKGLRSPQIMHPAREWQIGLFIAVGIFSVCAFFSVHTYLTHRNIDLAIEEDNTAVATVYRGSLVEAALQEFAGRNAKYSELRTSAESLVPPPLETPTEIEDVATTTESDNVATSSEVSIPVPVVSDGDGIVSVRSRFPEKLVYTDDMSIDPGPLMQHCAAEGGTFNSCGSVCPAIAQVCTEQCAYTCEFE